MSPDGSRLLVLLLFLILFRAFYAFTEHSIVEASDSKIKELAETDKKYRKLYDFISSPAVMMNAFSVHRAVSGISLGAVLVYLIRETVKAEDMYAVLWTVGMIVAASVIVITAADEIPKRIAEKSADEKTALALYGCARILMILMKPVVLLVAGLSFVLSKILGVSAHARVDVVTEEEILMMVDAVNETGVIEESQKEMINNIFEFGDVKVSEIMTHRTDIVGLDVNDKIRDIIYLAINKGFSRLPVYDGSVDRIIGIIYVKDFLCLVGCENPDEFHIKDFMREALYIPASNKCDEVFEIMTKKKVQMAVLVDEYGGTAGIVTMEDILEEIVGNIQDEYDEEEQDITRVSKNTYMISGAADPEDVLPVLHVKLPETREYDTMNAMIVDLLGRIPTESESPSVEYENIVFTVMVMEDNWVSRIKAVVPENITNEDSED